ncbi:MAG: hypothetical protein LBU61_04940 [Coriobacteriales bacterium]|jgi:cell division protein FtsL|nr:hypothetical protein [Coriobacteriales bacterium]
MAEPAYNYRTNSLPAEAPIPDRQSRPDLHVVPQTQQQRNVKTARFPVSTLVTFLVAMAIIIAVPFAYIWLVSDTMRMMVQTEQIQADINQSRSAGHRLESHYSALTNPQSIQRQAEELGMVQDPEPEYLRMPDDALEIIASNIPAGTGLTDGSIATEADDLSVNSLSTGPLSAAPHSTGSQVVDDQ